eukprot:TRINITY_DN17008_c0_g1_i1.p1 TRINITY_DN17008_c0_g1~~TRINITY_DN17008_c0_g1_i1.p1  ORF type:complete len:120 (-),score=35.73 TRINITY_DN17008_c0_g1_i1:122-481(-)
MPKPVVSFSVAYTSVFSLFLLFLAGFGLFLLGQLYQMVTVNERAKLGKFAAIMEKVFPFPKNQYEFNLSHVLMFALLICALSLEHHPAQDAIEHDADKDAKKREKRKEKERAEKAKAAK